MSTVWTGLFTTHANSGRQQNGVFSPCPSSSATSPITWLRLPCHRGTYIHAYSNVPSVPIQLTHPDQRLPVHLHRPLCRHNPSKRHQFILRLLHLQQRTSRPSQFQRHRELDRAFPGLRPVGQPVSERLALHLGQLDPNRLQQHGSLPAQ